MVSLLAISLIIVLGRLGLSAYLHSLTHDRPIWSQADHTRHCEQIDGTTLRLSGAIGKAMQDCALPLLTPDIKTVVVRSPGGEVYAGRAIGYKIGEQPRTLIIDKICLSSCGNYFVPASAEVKLRPGAVLGLHGTPDPQMLGTSGLEAHLAELDKNNSASALGAQRSLTARQEKQNRQLTEEAKFAAHFSIPKGWRLYREVHDEPDGWRRHFETGSEAGVTPDRFMIVEEAMLASCLPDVKIGDYQKSLERNVLSNPLRWRGLRRVIGAYRSHGLKCLATSP